MTRCSVSSEARAEPLWATASVVESFLLLEDPGPWGPHILHSARLPDAARAALRRWRREFGVRPLLVRRPGARLSAPAGPRRVIAVNARHGWAQSVLVDDLAEVAALSLAGVRSGQGIGWPPHPDPVVLVCTHGRHDPCCSLRGRPLAAALHARFPGMVWESSHLGGDRFAGNVVVLPRGDYYGRLDPSTGPDAVARHLAGSLDLDHHRGRCTQSWVVQAAEHAARVEFGADAIDDVTVSAVARQGGTARVRLLVRGTAVTAVVTTEAQEPACLTCHAPEPEPAPAYTVSLT